MNEEELKKGCGELWGVDNRCGEHLGDGSIDLCPTCQARLEGFQKGKLEAFSEVRKIMGEEVRKYDENMEAYSFRVLNRIKQLQKEIGEEKQDEN